MARRWMIGALFAVLAFGAFVQIPVVTPDDPMGGLVLDRNRQLLGARLAPDEQWRFQRSEDVPHRYRVALIAAEDKRFYAHPGVDPLAIARALIDNLRAGHIVRGGSTISMQVIRLARHNPPRTVSEKLLEMLLALRLDAALSKDDIVTIYSEYAPFGGNIVGLEAASWRYFERPPGTLSWAEAATFAVLPNEPGLVHPRGNRPRLKQKRDRLLQRLRDLGTIDNETYGLSLLEPLPPAPRSLPKTSEHLLNLSQRNQRGTTHHTTIDATLQEQAALVVSAHHARLSTQQIHNAAVLVIDVPSGDVLAYVGNTPGHDPTRGHAVDIVQARRSSGSTLKPFLYAGMLHEGSLLPHQLVPDTPFSAGGFAPQNYDQQYLGATPANLALARSRNVPSVRMLQRYGVAKFQDDLQRLGLNTLHRTPNDYGLTLILGGAEVRLWELTQAYRTLALAAMEQETIAPLRWSLDSERPEATNPMASGAAWATLEALIEVHRPGSRANWRHFQGGRKIGWKTGTSWGFRDGWALGITPEFVVGVWVGNASGEGVASLTGTARAAPILFDLFEILPATSWFIEPLNHTTTTEVCEHSGQLAGPDCEHTRPQRTPNRLRAPETCEYCERIHCDESCSTRVHAGCTQAHERQARGWFRLPPSQAWFYTRHHVDYDPPPAWRPDCSPQRVADQMELVRPTPGANIHVPIELDGHPGRVLFEAAHQTPNTAIHWHLDDIYLGTTHDLHQWPASPRQGAHRLTIVDEHGERDEVMFEVSSNHPGRQ